MKRMKKKERKLFVLALCVSVLLSALPLYAWASGSTGDSIVGTTAPTETVGQIIEDTIGDMSPETLPGETVPGTELADEGICPICGVFLDHKPSCPNAPAELQATVVEIQNSKPNKGFPDGGVLLDGYTYKLIGNITSCPPLKVPAGATVTLDLGGWMLEGNGTDPVIDIEALGVVGSNNSLTEVTSRGVLKIENNVNGDQGVTGYVWSDGVWRRGNEAGSTKMSMQIGFIHNCGSGMGIKVNGTLVMDGGPTGAAIIGCMADVGAAICASSSGQVTLINVDVMYNRTTRTNNEGTEALGWGGAVHCEKDYHGTEPFLKATDCDFYNNYSASRGGAISGNYVTMSGCKIYNNKAVYGGGMDITMSLDMQNCQVYNNTATERGAGIYIEGSATTVSISGGKIQGNITSNNYGGGIYSYGGTASFLLSGVTISDNQAVGGGGIMTEAASQDFRIENCTFYNNKATGPAEENSDVVGHGGGMYLGGATATILLKNCTIYENTSYHKGAGVYVARSTTTTTVMGGKIYNNKAGIQGVDNLAAGGGIYSEGSTVLDGGAVIDNNEATNNGAGVYSTWTLTLKNATVQNNKSQGDGGGMYACHIVVPADAQTVKILNNTASGSAGGMGATRSFKILGVCTIQGNTAGSHGGGIYRHPQMYKEASVINAACVITGNHAFRGGGIYIGFNTLTISGGAQITGNTASYGAGIYVNGKSTTVTDKTNPDLDDPSAFGTVIINNSAVTGNIADIHGGGIYGSSSSTITLNAGASVSNNTANSNTDDPEGIGIRGGGGICSVGAVVNVNGATISGNQAPKGYGGGIFAGGITVNITNSVMGRC